MSGVAFDSTSGLGEMGSKQYQKENNGDLLTADVDTSPPFASVMEAVSRFGGIGFWRPHSHNPTKPSQNDLATGKRETLEATKTGFGKLEAKLHKEEDEANTHRSGDRNNEVRVELSENEMLKRIKEATEDVKHCTRVLEEVLSRIEARNGTYLESDAVAVSRPVMSIGQILSRKLILAGERLEEKSCMRWKVSLAEILGKGSGNGAKRGGGYEKGSPAKRTKLGFGGSCGGGGGGEKGVPAKRMKLAFGGISFMVAKKKTCKESQ